MRALLSYGFLTRNIDDKERAARELRIHLSNVAPEVPAEQLTRYSNDINKRIFELLRNGDAGIRLGGVLAVDELIGEPNESPAKEEKTVTPDVMVEEKNEAVENAGALADVGECHEWRPGQAVVTIAIAAANDDLMAVQLR